MFVSSTSSCFLLSFSLGVCVRFFWMEWKMKKKDKIDDKCMAFGNSQKEKKHKNIDISIPLTTGEAFLLSEE